MKKAFLLIILLIYNGPAWGQGGFLGVYSDPAGSSCEVVDTGSGLCTYYVVHSLSPGTNGSRFRVVSGHTGTFLSDTPVFSITNGTSAAGVQISYGTCMDASGGLHVLSLNYFCQGTTPPCATFDVVAHPDGLSELDCGTPPTWVPSNGWTSFINSDNTCPCSLPGFPEMGVTPQALTETLCPGESSVHTVTISNTGLSDLEFEIAVSVMEPGGGSSSLDVLYYGESRNTCFPPCNPDTPADRIGERALQNLGIPFTGSVNDYDTFINRLTGAREWDLVVFEATRYEKDTTPLEDYVADGGVLISCYADYDYEFSAALNGLLAGGTGQKLDVSKWVSHPIFEEPNDVPDLLKGYVINWRDHSCFFEPLSGGVALAGYSPTPAASQAAIILGNDNRTLLNGMLFEDFLPTDTDGDGKDDIVELVENEIRFMLKPSVSVDIATGSVAPASSVDVEVTFNATRLDPGHYDADITITSNDPDLPEVVVTAQLDVPAAVATVAQPALSDTIPPDGTSEDSFTLSNDGACDFDFTVAVKEVLSSASVRSPKAAAAPRPSVEAVMSSIRKRSGILDRALRVTATRFSTGEAADIVVDRPEQVASTRYSVGGGPGPAVAILAGLAEPPTDLWWNLLQSGKFASVSFVDVTFATPTPTELQAFDAVVVWWDFPYQDRAALGNNLADYVDGGGGVLLAVPETAGETGKYLGGRWETDEYFVMGRSDFQTGQAVLGTILDPGHPIMKGVGTFDGGSFSFRPSASNLTAGATMVATWSDDMPLVVTKRVNGARRADLGFFLLSGGEGFWQSTTDGGVLIANALEWVAGFEVRWLSLSTRTGNIPVGGSAVIDVTFDGADLEKGTYEADIIIGHGDRTTPDIVVPVLLRVDDQVPVFIKSFAARAVGEGVEISWDILSDEDIRGFRIYRSTGAEGESELLNTNGMILPAVRTYVDNAVKPGVTYQYVLVVVQKDGGEFRSQLATVSTRSFSLTLYQNYPNPFNPTTTIAFVLPEETVVELILYALDGTRVRTLVDRALPAGRREVTWDGTDDDRAPVSSGVYFYRLTTKNRSLAKKMLYLK